MVKNDWRGWNPGLDNDSETLASVYQTLPQSPAENNRLLDLLREKPSGVTEKLVLFNQDCLHIVLGRGLLPQDEAFVIGYTMGTATSLQDWESGIFRLVSKMCTPGAYKFTDKDVQVFKLGIEIGSLSPVRDLYKVNFKNNFGRPLGEIRQELGVQNLSLREIYRREKELVPSSPASDRLSV